jgi:hypothetical protein
MAWLDYFRVTRFGEVAPGLSNPARQQILATNWKI